MDYLEKAGLSIDRVEEMTNVSEEPAAQSAALIAIACAQVAQAKLLAALIERLDALTEFDGGKALFVTLTEK